MKPPASIDELPMLAMAEIVGGKDLSAAAAFKACTPSATRTAFNNYVGDPARVLWHQAWDAAPRDLAKAYVKLGHDGDKAQCLMDYYGVK
jgi:hypothetical protein